jgi:hypothetical protein
MKRQKTEFKVGDKIVCKHKNTKLIKTGVKSFIEAILDVLEINEVYTIVDFYHSDIQWIELSEIHGRRFPYDVFEVVKDTSVKSPKKDIGKGWGFE